MPFTVNAELMSSTFWVALSPCITPAVGEPTFALGDDEMELGMCIHGAAGIERGKLKSADEIAQLMSQRVLNDRPFRSGDEVAVLANGLGATPPEELYLLYRKAHSVIIGRRPECRLRRDHHV